MVLAGIKGKCILTSDQFTMTSSGDDPRKLHERSGSEVTREMHGATEIMNVVDKYGGSQHPFELFCHKQILMTLGWLVADPWA